MMPEVPVITYVQLSQPKLGISIILPDGLEIQLEDGILERFFCGP